MAPFAAAISRRPGQRPTSCRLRRQHQNTRPGRLQRRCGRLTIRTWHPANQSNTANFFGQDNHRFITCQLTPAPESSYLRIDGADTDSSSATLTINVALGLRQATTASLDRRAPMAAATKAGCTSTRSRSTHRP